MASILTLAVIVMSGATLGRGAFARADPNEGLVALYLLLGLWALASLALAAAVSARERSRDALAASESLLRAVVEGTTDHVYVKDRGGRFLIVNPACAQSFGLPAAELVGKSAADLLPAEDARRIHAVDEEVMRTGLTCRTEITVTNRAGSARTYEAVKAPYRDRTGAVLGVVGISRDVTEQRSAEAGRAWLAAIVESSADAIIGETLDGTITSWNAAAQHLYGYSAAEAVGQPVAMLVPAEERGELAGLLERVGRGERILDHETLRCRKDGTKVEVALTLSPIREAAGAVIGVSAIARDLTQCAELQRLACEAAHLGMWFWTPKDDRLVWTPRCRRLFGIGPDEPLSQARYLAAVHPDDRERVAATVARALAERAEYQVECRVVWPDGSVHWMSGSGRVIVDEQGEPVRMMGTALDITAEKQAEQERDELLASEQAAREEAQEATRAKDEFLAVVSHELRTPLQAMLGWILILKGRLADIPLAQSGLVAIERNVKTQARLIEDLLDVSRIVAGKMRLARERVDLAAVAAAAVETVRAAADAKGVLVHVDLSSGCEVVGDPVRLQQVVSNLLTNAVKFTARGGHVSVRLERDATSGRIVVADDGRGIPPDFLPRIFERFRQAEGSMSVHGGLGLGLSIVRHLVERHGGAVRAESPGVGRGSTFTVTLPLVAAEQPALAAEPRWTPPGGPPSAVALATLQGVRVLVVDDDADARAVLEAALGAARAEVHAVGSARAALDELEPFHPHLLLSDIGMPDEDGYTLIRAIRERESAEGGHLPAVALTAFASQDDREQALALGFDAYLAKPARPTDLAATVARLVAPA